MKKRNGKRANRLIMEMHCYEMGFISQDVVSYFPATYTHSEKKILVQRIEKHSHVIRCRQIVVWHMFCLPACFIQQGPCSATLRAWILLVVSTCFCQNVLKWLNAVPQIHVLVIFADVKITRTCRSHLSVCGEGKSLRLSDRQGPLSSWIWSVDLQGNKGKGKNDGLVGIMQFLLKRQSSQNGKVCSSWFEYIQQSHWAGYCDPLDPGRCLDTIGLRAEHWSPLFQTCVPLQNSSLYSYLIALTPPSKPH